MMELLAAGASFDKNDQVFTKWTELNLLLEYIQYFWVDFIFFLHVVTSGFLWHHSNGGTEIFAALSLHEIYKTPERPVCTEPLNR